MFQKSEFDMIHFYHGLIGDHRHFSSVIQDIGPQYGVCHVPDISYQTADYSILRGTFDRQTCRASVHVGNSIGCGLAVHAAGANDQLILTAPPFDYGHGIVPLRKALVRDWIKGLYVKHGAIRGEAAFLSHATQQVHAWLESPAQIRRLRQYKSFAQAFWSDPRLTAAQDRVTFVIGAADFTTPADAFVEFVRKQFPFASVEVWEDCGHAVPLDAPDQLAAMIRHRCVRLKSDTRAFAQIA